MRFKQKFRNITKFICKHCVSLKVKVKVKVHHLMGKISLNSFFSWYIHIDFLTFKQSWKVLWAIVFIIILHSFHNFLSLKFCNLMMNILLLWRSRFWFWLNYRVDLLNLWWSICWGISKWISQSPLSVWIYRLACFHCIIFSGRLSSA